jgi:hypothetical protein
MKAQKNNKKMWQKKVWKTSNLNPNHNKQAPKSNKLVTNFSM